MSEIEIEPKNILKTTLFGGIGIILVSLFFMSWTDVNPGEEGFIYRPYTGGIDQTNVYTEGTVFIAPWNEMITYNILQQSRNYSSKVMEKNGMEIGIDVTINYNPMQNNTAKLHLKHGKAFESSFIDAKVRGVIKDVIGRYTYEEIYSTKRRPITDYPLKLVKYLRKRYLDNGETKDKCVLDIGCGWGGMALEIAKQTGAKVKGITLSENQFVTASRRAQEEGLSDKVSFQIQDYRDEKFKYDRIVSIGMFEHVGIKYFKPYLKKTYDLLKDNGVFLLHTIGQRGIPTATSPWIRKYIFPGGYIPSLSDIIIETQKLNINITDIEILRLHYAHTLSHWYKNIQKNKEKIVQMFDKRFYRMWEFYLLASKYSFVNMGNIVFQIQMAKNINNLPLTRNYMYN